jgi:ABC-2 type transport system ATP-binding protein
MARMQEIRRQGTTIFYVSHAAASVRSMCDRVLVLESGRLNFDGGVDEGIRYVQYDDDPEDENYEGEIDEELGADI